MTGRKKLEPGELRSVTVQNVGGTYQARGRVRDGGGVLRRPQASADTESEAIERLKAEAKKLGFVTGPIGDFTLTSKFLAEWLADCHERVRHQTLRVYTDTVRWLDAYVGGIPIGDFDTLRVKQVLKRIKIERSPAAVRQARVAFNGAFNMAIDDKVIRINPIAGLTKRAQKHATPKALEPWQVSELRAAIGRREERVRGSAGVAAGHLRWVTEVQLGAGLRIGEVLALRHRDVDLDKGVIEVTGTLIDDAEWRLVRQDELKSREQARKILIPQFVSCALSEAKATCVTIPSRLPNAPAIQSRAGTWINPRNIRRALREVRNDPVVVKSLAETGLAPKDLTPHILRRTAATVLAVHTGNLHAPQGLLGHTDERTTRTSYAGVAYQLVGDAMLLEQIFGAHSGDAR